MLRTDCISLVYDQIEQVYAVRDASLQIARGNFVALVGPSGSGKSSLLYLLSALRTPTQGTIWFEELNLTSLPPRELARLRSRHFGFVFQYHFLSPYLTGLENVLMGPFRITRARISRAHDLLHTLGIAQCATRLPHQMSGGQRQRVAVARALLPAPQIVFADEPTASVDRTTSRLVMDVLRQESETLVICTHDLEMVADADRWLVIRDGHVCEERPPNQIRTGNTA